MNRTQTLASLRNLASAVACLAALLAQPAAAVPVIAPDNGFGTATLPPTGETYYGAQMQIIDGLPPGSTIDIDNPLYHNFSTVTDHEVPAGPLNYGDGNFSDFAAQLTLPLQGTGRVQCLHAHGRDPAAPQRTVDAL
jgi:hypothetical protein